jgi:mannose-6-phosphate isomerase-like protein (cupin superfamily)
MRVMMVPMPIDPLATVDVAAAQTVIAPDGSMVRILLAGSAGSMAQFELAPGRTSVAVRHRTVEELWYVIAGRGEMWRRAAGAETVVPLHPGVAVLIPVGTSFQFRTDVGDEPLIIVAATMPPWPGSEEAEPVEGCPMWTAAP